MKLAKKFTFKYTGDSRLTLYTAEEDTDGQYIVTWEWPFPTTDDAMTVYSADEVRNHIVNAVWVVQEVIIGPESPYEPSLEPVDDIVAASWPFPVSTVVVSTTAVEPEFAPPEEVERVPDYGVLLSDLRRFTKDTGYSIDVDEEFYSFIYDGRVEYVVREEEDMAAVMQAIRTLAKFSDKG